jgi:hypothetical protein
MARADKTDHIIFNLNRLPFHNFDSAASMRDLLNKESDNHYRIEQYKGDTEGGVGEGFVVIRSSQTIDNLRDDQAGHHANERNFESDIQHDITSEYSEHRTQLYHPALRTYLLYLPILFAGALLLFFPQETWLLVLSAFDKTNLPGWVNIELLIKATKGVGLITFFYHAIGVLYSYFAITLIVDNQGVVLKKGIIAQDIINIRFSEIKTIGLKRGILARLINIGTLEFASSGSDGVDIRFINLASPVWVKQDIESRIEKTIRASKTK